MDRNEEMTRLRPHLNGNGAVNDEAQQFLHETVNPVIALQTPVLIAFLKGFAGNKSKHFSLYKTTEKVRFLKVLLRENDLIAQGVLGILQGVMTLAEVERFFELTERLQKPVMREVEALVEKNTLML